MQRAIQTQLYYLADLRDEPTYVWLREFLNHGHLDDKGRCVCIFDLSLMTLPFHLLGLKGLIGDTESFLEFKLRIGP